MFRCLGQSSLCKMRACGVLLCILCVQTEASDLQDLLRKALDEYVPPVPTDPVVPQNTPAGHHNQPKNAREGRQIHSADPGALMYLPIGGSGNIRWRVVIK